MCEQSTPSSVSSGIPRKVAILQSNYIPWKGYFDIIHDVDTFVLLEDVQYTKNDWRNRNLIKTSQGLQWLTVPVLTHEKLHQKICEAKIKDNDPWQKKHWNALVTNYGRAPHFRNMKEPFEELYRGHKWDNLSQMNVAFISAICSLLGIKSNIILSTSLSIPLLSFPVDAKNSRVLGICHALGAKQYLSGPAASDYLDESAFHHHGLEVIYKDYSGYPVYTQNYPPFEHGVSVLDLLFQHGHEAPWFIWGWRTQMHS